MPSAQTTRNHGTYHVVIVAVRHSASDGVQEPAGRDENEVACNPHDVRRDTTQVSDRSMLQAPVAHAPGLTSLAAFLAASCASFGELSAHR
jgi:hypothetical protein